LIKNKIITISVVMFLCVTIAVHAVTVIRGRGIRRVASGTPWDVSTNQVLHYKMNDDLADTVVIDSMTNSDGVLAGGDNTEDISEAGKINKALHFNGADDRVLIADSPVMDSAAITAMAWIKMDAVGKEQMVITRDSGSVGDRYFLLYVGSNNKLRVYTWNSASTGVTFDGSNTLSASTWHHVAFTYTSGVTKVYLDGVVDGSTASQTGNLKTGDEPIYLGVQNYDSTFYSWFDGLIDDVRILNRDLTVNEIAQIYNSGNGTEDDSNP